MGFRCVPEGWLCTLRVPEMTITVEALRTNLKYNAKHRWMQ
jgi:hypothetical protein